MIQTFAQAYAVSVEARQALVNELQQQDILHSERIRTALLETPREAFVPTFFIEKGTGRSSQQAINASHPDYIRLTYQNLPLVTHLNKRGDPDSSSSMPTVMVQMLEALDVQPYHTVLEIGTGTGWNAALLAHLAASCTTVDIEPSYVEHLTRIASDFHLETIHAAVADGLQGYPQHAPYDRIIVTASVPFIPMAWIEQLNINGRLVCDLAGSLARAFLVIEKDAQGQVSGRFLPQILYFMPLKSEALPDCYVRLPKLQPVYDIVPGEMTTAFLEKLQHDRSFRWFLQWNMPHIKLQHLFPQGEERICLIAPDDRSYLAFSRMDNASWTATLYAEPQPNSSISSFWEDLCGIYCQWEQFGKPGVENYLFCVQDTIPVLCLDSLILPMKK